MKRKYNRRKPHYPHRSVPIDEAPLIGRSPNCSDELFEAFMESVRAYEEAPITTLAHLLIRDGVQLPPPDTFTEESVHDKLWEVIRALARHRHFLYSTDHLSDLELYRLLWEETLNEPTQEITPEMGDCACHIDFTSDGADESIQIWLRHYADEMDRTHWANSFPDDPIPPHVDPPYDRDRRLPQRSAPPQAGEADGTAGEDRDDR